MKKLLLLSALLIFSCSTDSEGNPCIYEPTLTTQAATDITETSATLNGVISIVSENCDVPNNTEQGFVYSTEIQPTLDDTQVNVNGTNISTTIEGLTPNTTYYVRAFLTNTLGDFYGDEISFTTLGIPFLETFDGIVWEHSNVTIIDPNDPFFNSGCFFYQPYFLSYFTFRNNPPSKVAFEIFDPILGCRTILFSNPNYNIIEHSTNFLSYTYEDDLGVHLRTYTVSGDGNTLIYEDEDCIGLANLNIEFTRTEFEYNPSDNGCD